MRNENRKPWAVVQDLRPFGYRIECTHRTYRAARRCVAWSRYLSVMPLAEAREYNARTADRAEFDKELALYNQRTGQSPHRRPQDVGHPDPRPANDQRPQDHQERL
jgi:hypothetical protein